MESASLAEPGEVTVERPKLKANAIGFVSNIVIGVASVAPGYSLAATLGFIAAVSGLGFQAPAAIWVAFLPMAAIALAYYFLNKADPDCGTTFSWMTKAMGPLWGWQGGWAILVADVLVMPNLAQIAAQYTLNLFGDGSPSNTAVTIIGIGWIVLMTIICYIGIELNARTQRVLLAFEFFVLVIFAVVTLIKVYTGHPTGSVHPNISWFSPFAIKGGLSALNGGLLLAIFIYWGWDSGVSVNEETEDSTEAPGKAALISNVVLVLIYLLVTTAAAAYGGLGNLVHNQADVFSPLGHSVFGGGLDKILTLAILCSASASTQTTILPTARTTLSMGRAGAIPEKFGEVNPRFLSPGFSTIWMGTVSTILFVVLMATSVNLIADAFTALAVTIAFYYGFSGYACVIYYRKQIFETARKFVMLCLIPLLGALFLTWIIVKAVIVYSAADGGYAKPILGIGSPIAIALLTVVLGLIGMAIQRITMPAFFRRKREIAPADILAGDPIAVGRHG
ncbi:MAG TPA: APC family permease [Solirubrobacteraceae bacterium]|jgi:amino acid transporter|nr:APC family permease [Solirubrobacteraceae bacterium]